MMGDHRLERLFEAGGGTFGRLISAQGKRFASMERGWLDNRPRVSCVPPGRYELVPFEGIKFKVAWALVGEGVTAYPAKGSKRSSILMHAANFPSELEGCIALGTLAAGRSTMLRDSRRAIRAFFGELDDTARPHWLEIVGGE